MNRTRFLSLLGLSSFTLFNIKTMAENIVKPETHFFKDDGIIPNSQYPLLHYQKAFTATGPAGASWLEQHFAQYKWTNSWRNGVYPFHHYHSTSHEVLGIYNGSALLHLGGERGQKVKVEAGDIIVIPAGVGHKNLGSSTDFGVVGAYPDGRSWDVMRGQPGERPKADERIAALPVPDFDPFLGKAGGLVGLWT
ncbi:cupin domain-containing protein [Mucilaginibacter sp. HMF7410]|uniref:Cupin domain-containing protein n=1 Tax=Mucilaginibacter arboris TaxID=2682090 RepID=A0A7K1SWQ2_9SPHI|nr:cupin domain-containing protein [Mucilaginibacter arboris]MVN21752.1 cupin domain-containing protein [Mucilaginibacter arboris]